MANIAAIRSVGNSLAEYLDRAYQAAIFPVGVAKPDCNFGVVSSGRIQEEVDPDNLAARVLIFLYHVSIDPHLRNSGRMNSPDGVAPLSVDLHYLFTFWSNSAENEQLVLGWTMLQLQATPLLDATILSTEAEWAPEEVVHIIPEELSTADMMRVWDTLQPEYRLSLGYVARVVRIEPHDTPEAGPVVATRFNFAVPSQGS